MITESSTTCNEQQNYIFYHISQLEHVLKLVNYDPIDMKIFLQIEIRFSSKDNYQTRAYPVGMYKTARHFGKRIPMQMKRYVACLGPFAVVKTAEEIM